MSPNYVSDEALCLDWDSGRVLPYPRPLALPPWSATAVGVPAGNDDVLVTAEDLGARLAGPPLVVAHVVLLERAEGGAVALDPVGREEAAAELLSRSLTSWRRPDRAFALVQEVLAEAATWRLTLGDPQEVAAAIAGLLR